MRPIKLSKNQFAVTKDGKVKRIYVARDASHAIQMKKSKKQKPTRRVV